MEVNKQQLITQQNSPLHQIVGATNDFLEIEIGTWAYTHWFIGVDFFSDEEGTNEVVPSAGEMTYSVVTITSSEVMGVVDGTISDLSDPSCSRVRNFAGNPEKIRVTFNGVSGAAFARFRAVGNMN